jgi:valyl-tRNA synthetase
VVPPPRPETMLGDTAVALNPEDARYTDLDQTSVMLPLMNREIPIIRDAYVDLTFGTGALKVTPAHDPNDFEIGRRHTLESVKVIGDDGRMTPEAGRYAGLDRTDCRDRVVADLEKEGLLERVENHTHNVGHCYRCKTVVEPNLSKQWFVSARPLAEKAIAAVENGRTKIVPEMWTKTYYDWMHNIRDWCISRQIWWGHQIPAWTCSGCDHMVVAMTAPDGCPECGGTVLIQETDVLDTWFSSALWPFSTMGWPEETGLLKTFYPTSVLVTGFDILFFWVARMMMMGIHFMGEVPFTDVYVHALVRDEAGKKMSKSKGNVIDPLNIIETYGTDAFRFTLAAFAAQGRDVKMSEKRVEGYRHFVNKLWNAARFALMHLDRGYEGIDRERLSLPDRWIVSRLDRVTAEVADAIETYRFNDAAGTLYQFIWHEFCDWYLEAVKPALYGNGAAEGDLETTRSVLWTVLHDIIVLLHPFMPFVTEEIWSHLPGTEGSVMTAAFPGPDNDARGIAADPGAEADMGLVTEIITGIRNIRGEMNLSPGLKLNVSVQSPDDRVRSVAEGYRPLIVNLASLGELAVGPPGERPKSSATAIVGDASIFVSLAGIIDFEKEKGRLQKEIDKLTAELVTVSKKLNNEDFLGKAPADVVEKVREKHRTLDEKQQKLVSTLERIRGLEDQQP